VQKKRQWMDEQLQKLTNLPKYNDPPVTVSQIETETKVSGGVVRNTSGPLPSVLILQVSVFLNALVSLCTH